MEVFLAPGRSSFPTSSEASSLANLAGVDAIPVLVVDDDAFTRQLVLKVLRDLGHAHSEEAAGAAAAIALLETKTFGVIVTDTCMPGMNGLQLVQQIPAGKTAAPADTRIVVLTSYSKTRILAAALELDVNGFLVKPIVPEVVKAKLRQACAEPLRLRPPQVYEAVNAVPGCLCPTCSPGSEGALRAGSAVPESRGQLDRQAGLPRLALEKLRPGMMLRESVFLVDDTLLLLAGEVLTGLSINRLRDLSAVLSRSEIAVEEGNS